MSELVCVCVWGVHYIYVIGYGRPIRERACVLDRIRARERSMTVFDVRRRFVDRPTFCVSLHPRLIHTRTLQQQQCVYSHISACGAILCYISVHTQIIYRGNTVVGGALSLGECRGGYIYSYSRLVVKAKSFCVYRPLPPVPLSLFCSPRTTHVSGVREMLLKRHKHQCLHHLPLESS